MVYSQESEGMCIATGVHLKKEEEEEGEETEVEKEKMRRRHRWRRGGGGRGREEEEEEEKQQLMETKSQTQIWQIVDRDRSFPATQTRNNHSETFLIKSLLAQ